MADRRHVHDPSAAPCGQNELEEPHGQRPARRAPRIGPRLSCPCPLANAAAGRTPAPLWRRALHRRPSRLAAGRPWDVDQVQGTYRGPRGARPAPPRAAKAPCVSRARKTPAGAQRASHHAGRTRFLVPMTHRFRVILTRVPPRKKVRVWYWRTVSFRRGPAPTARPNRIQRRARQGRRERHGLGR